MPLRIGSAWLAVDAPWTAVKAARRITALGVDANSNPQPAPITRRPAFMLAGVALSAGKNPIPPSRRRYSPQSKDWRINVALFRGGRDLGLRGKPNSKSTLR